MMRKVDQPVQDRAWAFLGFLIERGLLDPFGAQRAKAAIAGTGQTIDTVLLELGLIEENKLADALSEHLGLERINHQDFPPEIPPEVQIPHDFLRQACILPINMTDDFIILAVAKPLEDDAPRAIGYFLDREPIIKIAIGSDLTRHLSSLLAQDIDTQPDPGQDFQTLGLADSDAERLRDIASEAPTVRLLNRLVSAAIEQRASDIHIEPVDDHVRVRFRIDGALRIAETLDRGVQLAIISRIKILARLNIAEQRLPQDGRIRLAIRGREIDFRVSTSPTLYGESVVLRVLDRKDVALTFPALGFDEAACAQLERLIATPNGVILVTGPTGSGKTTTLYAGLSLLNREVSKVFTVEDPIEYHMRGVNQVLVRPHIGLDFSTVLRSILRQDPDIIMVGEIRDAETAKIAIQASLTGHVVLSTLHTNSAVASITRLRNIGIEDFLIVSSVRAIIAQRLVRKLCDQCKRPISPPTAALGAKATVSGHFHGPVGCKSCNGTGYSGRTVIYEILEFNDKIQQAVIKGVPDNEIEAIAKSEGMLGLFECGLSKARSGQTSIDEILRIVAAPAT